MNEYSRPGLGRALSQVLGLQEMRGKKTKQNPVFLANPGAPWTAAQRNEVTCSRPEAGSG